MGDKKKILVTGTSGQLGSELQVIARLYPQFDFLFSTRQQMPLDNPKQIKEFIAAAAPDYIVNAAAYTAVDKAETAAEEAAIAKAVNTEAPALLAEICRERNISLLHISTDYVFDGSASQPYKEEDTTNPRSVYGLTKRDGESEIAKRLDNAIIIRTSWVYSSFGKNFVKTMIRLMSEKQEIGVVSDQLGSPTYAADLAAAILAIIASGKWNPGIYHYSNTGVISWFDFATAIAEEIKSGCIVKPITTDQYPVPAPRPAYSVLNTEKITAVYGISIPQWRDSLRTCLQRIKNTPTVN